MSARERSSISSVLAACAAGLLSVACAGAAPEAEAPSAAELLRAAVAAHGGADALAELDDLRVSSSVVFRDGVRLERSLHFRLPSSLAMRISHDGYEVMSFGLDGERCWRRHRAFVLDCEPSDIADHRRILAVIDARVLHRLDPASATSAGTVRVGAVDAPAVRIGDMRLAFDPSTHHLIGIDYVDRGLHHVETYSELTTVGRAVIATRRVLTIDGVQDVSETWTEIVPHGSDPALFGARPAPEPGAIFDGMDAARVVAWVDVAELAGATGTADERRALAHRELVQFVRGRSMRESGTEGPIVSWQDGSERVAITLEEVRVFEEIHEGAFHVTTWPAARYLGTYVRGSADEARGSSEALHEVAAERGLQVVTGASLELLLVPEAEERWPAERFGLVRIAVEP